MVRYRATLAYDGTAYYGYQRQPDFPTIQGTVEAALAKILRKPTTVYAAGRTDTGVHAIGQVIAFDADWRHDDATLLKAVNSQMPDDIALQDLTQHADFHPRYHALSRTYRYTLAVVDVRQPLLAKRAWQMHGTLDETLLHRAAQMLLGEHDFAAFGTPPQGNNTVRNVYRSEWQAEATPRTMLYHYTVEATAFLYHMVRRMVAIQVAVGRGHITLDTMADIVTSADLARNKWIAPPQGLTFVAVKYPTQADDHPQRKQQAQNDGSEPSEVR